MTITKRATKGSALTHNELDANFDHFSTALQITGTSVSLPGTLAVTGAATLASAQINGNAAFGGAITTIGAITHFIGGNISVAGTTSLIGATDFSVPFTISDSVVQPSAVAGKAKIYVDSADGALKVIHGGGTVANLEAGSGLFAYYAYDVVASASQINQASKIQAYINLIKTTGGYGTIILPPSTSAVPIWIGTELNINDLLYLRIEGQGNPGLSGGYGTVLRQMQSGANTEVRIFNGSSGMGVIHFKDFACWGPWNEFKSLGTDSMRHFRVDGAKKVTYENIGSYYCRHMGLTSAYCDQVYTLNCEIKYCARDAINHTGSSKTVTTGNHIDGCNDDAIAIHTNTTIGNPVNHSHIVSDNHIEDAFGIKLIGATKAIITNNIIDRPKGYGVIVYYQDTEGENDVADVLIDGNIITNVINADFWPGFGTQRSYIYLSSDTDNFFKPITGAATPRFVYPELHSPVSNIAGSRNAGGQAIRVSNNILRQTLPKVVLYSEWGYGQSFGKGNFQDVDPDGTIFLTGNFHMGAPGVTIAGALISVAIVNNTIECVSYPVFLPVDFTHIEHLIIRGNTMRRFADFAVWANHATLVKHGRIDFDDNYIDGDPFFDSANRDTTAASTIVGSSIVNVSAAAPGVITWTAHGLVAGTRVQFSNSGGALPAGLTAATNYYVRSGGTLLAGSFTVSTTNSSGAGVTTTDTGTGVQTAEVYVYANTATVSAATTAIVTMTAHGLPVWTKIRFTTSDTLPAGLTLATDYFVINDANYTTNTFAVATYLNGPAKPTTTTGIGVHTVTARPPDGTWTAGDGTPGLMEVQDFEFVNITNNKVRNINTAVTSDSDTRFGAIKGNVVYMQPDSTATIASPAATANAGVRSPGVLVAGPTNTFVYVDSVPTSQTYLQIPEVNFATTGSSSALPTSGYNMAGQYLENRSIVITGGKHILGWKRLTTSNAHAAGVDWEEVVGFGPLQQFTIPIGGNAKVGATAGWVITGSDNISHATLPAGVAAATLLVPIEGLRIGATVTAVELRGQMESGGNTVETAIDVRKLTNAAADNTDASIGTISTSATVDTILTLPVTGLSEVLAINESLYVLITGTTAAATDIDLTHLLVSYTL